MGRIGAFLLFVPAVWAADFNRDGVVNETDIQVFVSCHSGPSMTVLDGCEMCDLDGDGDVDQVDFGALQISLGNTVSGRYYVNGQDGSDTMGDGSQEMPWRTIQHALNQADDGDTIKVAAGSYAEGSYLTVSGSKAIVIESLSGDRDVTISSSSTARVVYASATPSLTFRGVTFDGTALRVHPK